MATPRGYSTFQDFEREQIRPEMRFGWSTDELENTGDDLDFDQVVEFERFDARRVEHLALVLDVGALRALRHIEYPAHAFGQTVRKAEHAAVQLHGAAQFGADFRHAFA